MTDPRVLELLEAATSMRNEVTGVLGAFEDSLRQEMGNTNVAVLRHCLEKLSSAIASLDSSEDKDKFHPMIGFNPPQVQLHSVRKVSLDRSEQAKEGFVYKCDYEHLLNIAEHEMMILSARRPRPTPPSTAPKDKP